MHGGFNHRPKQTYYKYRVTYEMPHSGAQIEITAKGFNLMNEAISHMTKELKAVQVDAKIRTRITPYKK